MIEIDSTIEIWLLVALNFLGFILGLVITSVSYYAYRSGDRKRSLRNATVGFGLLTLGTAIEPAYQLGVKRTHVLASEQNVTLQVLEGLLLSLGFLILFLSIYKYSSRSSRRTMTIKGIDEELFEGPD